MRWGDYQRGVLPLPPSPLPRLTPYDPLLPHGPSSSRQCRHQVHISLFCMHPFRPLCSLPLVLHDLWRNVLGIPADPLETGERCRRCLARMSHSKCLNRVMDWTSGSRRTMSQGQAVMRCPGRTPLLDELIMQNIVKYSRAWHSLPSHGGIITEPLVCTSSDNLNHSPPSSPFLFPFPILIACLSLPSSFLSSVLYAFWLLFLFFTLPFSCFTSYASLTHFFYYSFSLYFILSFH